MVPPAGRVGARPVQRSFRGNEPTRRGGVAPLCRVDIRAMRARPLDETTWPDFARLVERTGRLGKHRWLVTKVVPAAPE
jgi:hypothetical protein